MISVRENPRHTIALRDVLARAFSQKVCGADLHKRYSEWLAYLTTNLESDAIVKHQCSLAESKTKPIKFNRLSPCLYDLIWRKFCLANKVSPDGDNILQLIGEFYRIAESLDTIEHIESENENYQKFLVERKCELNLIEKPNVEHFESFKINFEKKCTRDYQPQLTDIAFNYFKDQLQKHTDESKRLSDQIAAVEEKMSTNASVESLERSKRELLETIAEYKATLSQDIATQPAFEGKSVFKSIEEDYDHLNEQIETLNQYYEKKQEKLETKNHIPIIYAQTLEELNTLQSISLAKRNKNYEKEKIKKIEKILYANRPSWIYGLPTEWNELQTVAIEQQTIWNKLEKDTLANRENIATRITNIKLCREDLIRQQRDEETARIRQAEQDCYQLSHQIMHLRDVYQKYSQRNDQKIREAYKIICRDNQSSCKKQEAFYDALQKRVASLELNKIPKTKMLPPKEPLLLIRPALMTPPPRPLVVKKTRAVSSRPPRASKQYFSLIGLLSFGVAFAAFSFLIPPAGMIAAGVFGIIGVGSWVHSIIQCKRSCTHPDSSVEMANSDNKGNNTGQIQQSLAANIRRYGLNPDKGYKDYAGGMTFSLTNGRFLNFSEKEVRLYSQDARMFTQITSSVLPKSIDNVIAHKDRLRR